MSKRGGWIGVDLDGTLAEYHGWEDGAQIGAPIPAMIDRVHCWLAEGREVRILTARVWPRGTDATVPDARWQEALLAYRAILDWCRTHLGRPLEVTCVKDPDLVELWDDRAVAVIQNTGHVKGLKMTKEGAL